MFLGFVSKLDVCLQLPSSGNWMHYLLHKILRFSTNRLVSNKAKLENCMLSSENKTTNSKRKTEKQLQTIIKFCRHIFHLNSLIISQFFLFPPSQFSAGFLDGFPELCLVEDLAGEFIQCVFI